MKIIVDEEGYGKLTKLTDACLKAYGNQVITLVSELLGSVQIVPNIKEDRITEDLCENKAEEKTEEDIV